MSAHPEQDMLSWLRSQILARKATAEAAAHESGDATWTTGGPYSDDVSTEQGSAVVVGPWAGGFLADPLREHVALNDPRDTIARCEFELGLLAAHEHAAQYAANCSVSDAFGARAGALRDQVLRLATSYRHLPGWREDWSPR